MRKSLAVAIGWTMAIGWLLVSRAHAAAPSLVDYTTQKSAEETKYKTPEDLLDKVPFLADLPRTFLLGDGYKMKLSAQELQIDHMGTKSHNPASQRICMVGLSYSTPVAFFSTRVDLPLLHAPSLRSAWQTSSLGDYVAYFSRTPIDHPSLKLVITAKF